MRRVILMTCLSCFAAAALATPAAAAPKDKTEALKETAKSAAEKAASPVGAPAVTRNAAREKAFATAEKQGLVMKGYQDAAGLARILNYQRNRYALNNPAFDAQARKIKELGADFDAIKELDELLRGGAIAVERVEFIPGFEASEAATGIVMRPDQIGEFEGNEFSPGFPDKGSLAGYDYSFDRRPDGGYRAHTQFNDGSVLIEGSSPTAGGSGKEHFVIVISDARIRVSERTVVDKDGNVLSERVHLDPEPHQPSEAEQEYDRRNGIEVGEPEIIEEGEEDIAGYQPSDGTSGVFCPMSLDICRREYERAMASGEKVFGGMIFVNPAEPDDQPQAPRIIYNPQDLASNPFTRRGASSKAVRSGGFRSMIPVLINPPGPGEELESARSKQ